MSFLTERQQQVLELIRRSVRRRGVAPTLAEIAEELGFRSTASAQKQIAYLERKGFVRRVPNQARGLVLLGDAETSRGDGAHEPSEMGSIPLLGSVAAGAPIAVEEQQDSVVVPPSLVSTPGAFALRVSGESMIEEGIQDGDLIILEPRTTVTDGETVVALVDGDVTLKRLFREDGGTVRLQPANATVAPIRIAGDRVQVQGAVVALLRYYR
jgi:repressor LexA